MNLAGLKWFGTVAGVAGALLLAINIKHRLLWAVVLAGGIVVIIFAR